MAPCLPLPCGRYHFSKQKKAVNSRQCRNVAYTDVGYTSLDWLDIRY